MRATWVLLLLVPALSGCFGFLDDGGEAPQLRDDDFDDPGSYTVTGYRVDEFGLSQDGDGRIESDDGTKIAARVYAPTTRDAQPDGTAFRFPVLILIHPFGYAKEFYEQDPRGEPGPEDPRVNLMERFAMAGFITVAYDVRGFGQSGAGQSTGEAQLGNALDMQDLEAVRREIQTNGDYDHNGHFGVAGVSLGAGLSMLGLVDNPEIDAAASIAGWDDLYDGLLPGNVPKAQWSLGLLAQGEATTGGQFSNEVEGWIQKSIQRDDLATVEAGMDVRSPARRLPATDKPLFLCQGMQESLFPQIDRLWQDAGGFTRAAVVEGGHGFEDSACWDHIEAWMDFFLRGVDNEVPDWPFLRTIDAFPDGPALSVSEEALAGTANLTRYLHDENLVAGPSGRTFTVSQNLVSNPLQEPAIVGDVAGSNELPEQFRQDPTATFFVGDDLESSAVVLGAPKLTLDIAGGDTDFQVVATLYAVDADGNSRLLTRGAYSHKDNVTPPHDGQVEVQMHWTKATVPAGGHFVVKVGGNDLSWFLQFPANYEVEFSGESRIDIPLLQG